VAWQIACPLGTQPALWWATFSIVRLATRASFLRPQLSLLPDFSAYLIDRLSSIVE
jgi:hypothetical protein